VSDAGVAPNKRAGVEVEDAIIASVDGLEAVPNPDAHHDAVCRDAVHPSADLPMVLLCVLERGTHVEIKSALDAYTGGREQRGRFYFRPQQHAALLDAGGSYLFAVCERGLATDARTVIARKVVPATIVDDVLPEWFDGGEGRGDYAQVSWSRLFRPEEVARQ
jgi:hypothetical protein